jgi:hypothetical protein
MKGFDYRRHNDANADNNDKLVPDGEEMQEKETGKKLVSRVQKRSVSAGKGYGRIVLR